MLSRLVHELRTPIGSLRLLGEQLSDATPDELAERGRFFARGIGQIVGDLTDLLDELSELGRARSGRLQVLVTPVRLDELADWVASRLETLAAEQGHPSPSVTRDERTPRSLRSDGDLVRRILDLLLSSAAAVANDGAVRVGFGPAPGGGLEIAIVDSGAPVEAGDEELVFTELHAHPRNRRRHGGTKLTLALARELARVLGGDVRIASANGETRAVVSLPDLPSDGP